MSSGFSSQPVQLQCPRLRLETAVTDSATTGMSAIALPPTGKVRYEEMLILRIRNGQVVWQPGIADNLNALRQLGVIPIPSQPPLPSRTC